MKLSINIMILAAVLSTAADARISRKMEAEYLNDAKNLGACKDLDVFQTLEEIYAYCDASDGQFDKLNDAYDSGAKCESTELPGIINTKYQLMITFNTLKC